MRQADASSIVPRGRHSPVVVAAAAVQQPAQSLRHFGLLLQKVSESDLLDAREAWVDQFPEMLPHHSAAEEDVHLSTSSSLGSTAADKDASAERG